MNVISDKLVAAEDLPRVLSNLVRPMVFTNGCFDILHRGHVHYLEEARALGGSLVVGVNSDASIAHLGKGPGRPINPLADRAALLAALASVSLVVPFDEATPLTLIRLCRPDVLVKGGDWLPDQMVGATEVRSWGGVVQVVPIRFERSTTALIARIRGTS